MVNKWFKQLVIGFNSVNENVSIMPRGKLQNEKDELYGVLETAYRNYSRNGIKIILGDMNTEVGLKIVTMGFV